MLDEATITLIKATVPAVKAHGDAITACFYPLMFEQYPEVIPYFNQTNQAKGTQPKALANAVIAYAENIDALGNLSDAVTKIVHKHCALGIQPEQYPIVGDCLLQAIAKVLGDAATDDIISAWGKAYGQLADILIGAEEAVYAAHEQLDGGWRGERTFTLTKRVDESSVITSFYFEPSDGGTVPTFDAGQYITLVLDVNGQSVRRNYSLSDSPNNRYFRISVKREPNGVVSGHLHNQLAVGDTVQILPPSGDFVLLKNDKPLVLLTAGVGITPAISMLNVEAASGRDIHFIHAALNSSTHAFKSHVDTVAAANNNVSTLYVYDKPNTDCQPDAKGFITEALLSEQLPCDRDVEFYLLGPKPFMAAALSMATKLGVPVAQIHYEFFGPLEDLTA